MLKRLLHLLFALTVMLIVACKKDDETIKVENPTDPTDTTTVQITPEKRAEVLNKINQFLNTTNAESRSSYHQQVQDFLKAIPEFAEVGYSEEGGNVWARFKDGALYLVVNNRPIQDIPEPNWEELKASVNNQRKASSNARMGLPETDEVLLFNSLGNYFPSTKNARNVIKTFFENKGYHVTLKEGTVDNLMSVKNTGIFYHSTHGGMVKNKKGEDLFALYTSDSSTVANERKYASDIKKDNIVFLSATHNYGRDGKVQYETHLGITPGFVEKYMTFSQNAMMYLDACQSFRDPNFYFAFLKKSSYTGTYLGWTDNVDDKDAYATALYYFDRLLASNAIYSVVNPENPKQRAFDIPAIFEDLDKKGGGMSTPYKTEEPNRHAFLKYKDNPNSTTLLRPSIGYIYVDESKDGLYLWGSFGDDPGDGQKSVTVDGVEVEKIESWEANFIMCKIKPSGKGSAGDVIVKVRDHASHPRTLTEWRGVIKYNRPSAGSMLEEVTMNVHIRRDINKYRDLPGKSPVPIPLLSYLFFARDSHGSYKMSGSAQYSFTDFCTLKQKATWETIQGDLPLLDPFDPDRESKESFNAALFFTDKGFQVKHFNLKIFKESIRTVIEDGKCPDAAPTHSEWTHSDLFENIDEDAELNMLFDANFNVKSGQWSAPCFDKSGIGDFPDKTMTIEWSNMTPNFLPKSNAAL